MTPKPVLYLCLIWCALTACALGDERSEARRLAPKYRAAVEVRLSDGSRADLVSRDYVYEVEWSSKHYQAPGQATWYSIVTGKKPAVILLVKDQQADARHVERSKAICKRLNIRLYVEAAKESND